MEILERKKEAEEKKRLREAKRLETAAKKTGKRKAVPNENNEVKRSKGTPLNSEKKCYKCGIVYNNSAMWMACENCTNWICETCVPPQFKAATSLEFFCSLCQN
jgi:hypothetical protein